MLAFSELGPADAEVFDRSVVPRYLSLFGELALELLVTGHSARVLHIGCRTGYPDTALMERIDHGELVGLDGSEAALGWARRKAELAGRGSTEYRRLDDLPGDLEPGTFTHALCLHPIVAGGVENELFSAMRWLLCSGGQAVIALPLRGSFHEIVDLLQEYAIKHENPGLERELRASLGARPSLETLSEQLEEAGFDDVDVEVRQVLLPFDSGQAFLQDPVSRLLILPELGSWLERFDLSSPLQYVRDAIDQYWSESQFEVSVNVGVASARCP